ncbi:MAG: hypothetical protein LQ338_006381 [Usnochroma carphineum]|nr:MAG: hypothetical protein LQ338_006381 [Usnochroma carphineum]
MAKWTTLCCMIEGTWELLRKALLESHVPSKHFGSPTPSVSRCCPGCPLPILDTYATSRNPVELFSMSPLDSNDDKGATGAAKFVTSTVGNTVGGLGRTVGGIVGAGGRGLGQTVTGATGSAGQPIGEALESLGNGIEGGTKNVSKGVEDAGKWK